MITKQFDLSGKTGGTGVTLTAYLHEPSAEMPRWTTRPAVVVCPGGGYCMCSDREADPIALSYLSAGFNAFVLRYSLLENAEFPQPLCDLSFAMQFIRENAKEWGILPDKIAVCGFSAGGHLTASLGTLWNHPQVIERTGLKNGENRPNVMILCYPVITTSWMINCGCMERLVGKRNKEETVRLLDCSKNVGEQTPPAFITHTYMDNTVPAEDSLAMAAAMAAADIPFELHIFEAGSHGLSLGNALTCDIIEPGFQKWMDLSVNFLWHSFNKENGHKAYRAKPPIQ